MYTCYELIAADLGRVGDALELVANHLCLVLHGSKHVPALI